MDVRSILTVLLAAVAGGGVFYLFVAPHLNGEATARKRHERIVAKGADRRGETRAADAASRRKQVSDSLKELERRNAEQHKISIETRLVQAGLTLSKLNFLLAAGAAAAATALTLFGLSGNPLFGLAGLVIGGLGLPHVWLGFMTRRRLKKFAEGFPNSLDIIIRGVKAGLPLGDCLRVIAAEAAEPLRTEFRQIVEAQTLGLSVAEAIERLPKRIPTPEAHYFAIVISIQQKSGGNLGEALANLARVLRERKKMRDKVKAISSEAKASAMIIGSLPIVVAGLVYLTSPHYIELLWTTDTGRIVLGACALVMGIGIFIMHKMISFDI
jgi:tight adherence protein B